MDFESNPLIGLGMGVGIILFVAFFIILVFYVVNGLGLYQVFKKSGNKGWAGFVPYYSDWVLVEVSGCHWWYFLIIISLLYFALYNPENFKRLMKFIIVTQVAAMVIYIVFPNRQDMRPDIFVRDNILTGIMKIIYATDTSTNVCPSLHVAYSVGIASTWLKEPAVSKKCKGFITVFCFLICISVAFVKQHSVVDIFAAIPICILAEWIAFGNDYWKQKVGGTS